MIKILIVLAALLSNSARAEDYLPSNLLMLDSLFTHHVLLVEKATHTLSVYENDKGFPKLVQKFKIASGKNKGDKGREGDRKTPEGIYNLNEFLSDQVLKQRHGEMAKMYGLGAFTTDYPNLMDMRAQKTGGGIWLHSTDDATRIDKGLDSRGCVVVNDYDLKQVSKYLDMGNTPIVIVQDVHYLSRATWERNREDLKKAIDGWSQAWKEKRFNDYISYYHREQFRDRSKGNYSAYKAYKQAVFSRPDTPSIGIDAVSALVAQNYAVVTLRQDYRSAVINDTGKKTLYLMKDENYDWKIVAELWEKMPEKNDLAFTPAMRFFKE